MISFVDEYDVIVCGGGISGVCAAFGASKSGAKTALVERFGVLGGMSTTGMIGNFLTFHSMRKEKIVGGIAQEIVDRMEKNGGCFPSGHQRNAFGHAGSVTPFDDEVLKYVLFEMAEDYKVDVYLHTYINDVLKRDDSVNGVIVETKSGTRLILGKVLIDSTGDGDIAYLAGVPMSKGRESDEKCMAMTGFFKMGGIQTEVVIESVKQNPQQFKLGESPYIGKSEEEVAKEIFSITDYPLLSGYFDLVKEKRITGEFLPPRQRIIFSFSPVPGFVYVNTTNVIGYDGTNVEDLTIAEREVRKQIENLEDFFKKNIPGFEKSYIAGSAITIGIRETRRIIGEYILQPEDVLDSRDFPDCIGRGGYCVDDHQPDGTIYHLHAKDGGSFGIPYRCLLPLKIDNLLAAGRIVSATHVSSGSVRVMAQCMATGHAAGVAAALSIANDSTPRNLNVNLLQETLRSQEAIL